MTGYQAVLLTDVRGLDKLEVFTVPPHSRRIPGGMDANSMWIPSIPYGICLAEGPAI